MLGVRVCGKVKRIGLDGRDGVQHDGGSGGWRG